MGFFSIYQLNIWSKIFFQPRILFVITGKISSNNSLCNSSFSLPPSGRECRTALTSRAVSSEQMWRANCTMPLTEDGMKILSAWQTSLYLSDMNKVTSARRQSRKPQTLLSTWSRWLNHTIQTSCLCERSRIQFRGLCSTPGQCKANHTEVPVGKFLAHTCQTASPQVHGGCSGEHSPLLSEERRKRVEHFQHSDFSWGCPRDWFLCSLNLNAYRNRVAGWWTQNRQWTWLVLPPDSAVPQKDSRGSASTSVCYTTKETAVPQTDIRGSPWVESNPPFH